MFRVGIAGPVSMDLLDFPSGPPSDLPQSYDAPVVSHFANAILRRGHRVVVYTTSRSVQQSILIDQGQLAVWVVPRRRPRSVLRFHAAERRDLCSAMRRGPKVDVVHAMWSYEFALAALQSGIPSLVHYRDHAWTILRFSRDPYRLFRWLLSSYVTLRAHCKAANSEYLKSAYGRRGADMIVVPNFLPAPPEAAARDLEATRSYAITVSNGFAGRKNVGLALEAFRILRQRGIDMEYRLVGADLGPGQVAETHAQSHGLTHGVRFLGRLPYVAAAREVAGAAVLLHPALEESFGMTVLEAMSAGVPVVGGADSGNVPELLDFGRCGLLCDVRSPQAIADAVEGVLTNPDLSRQLAEEARARYLERYSEETVMDILEPLYADLASQSK